MRTACLSLFFVLLGSPAFAQVPSVPAPPRVPPGAAAAPAGLSGNKAGSPAAAAASPITIPPPPPVSDPMLTAVPPPKRVLASWDEVLTLLRARSTDLRVALDQVLSAEAATRTALAAYLPTVTGTGTLTHNFITTTIRPSGQQYTAFVNGAPVTISVPAPLNAQASESPTPTYTNGSISGQQAIVNAPAFDQISIDELNEDAARLSVDNEKRTLALAVANQVVSVVTAERAAEINRVGLRVALEQLEITARKERLGAANGLDVVRAQQNAANARATLVSGDETLREAREALGLAVGIPEEVGVAPDIDVNALASSALASCRPVPSIEERSDVAVVRKQLEVAKRNLRNVYLQFLPQVNVQSTLSRTGLPLNGFPATTWSIQGVLSVPIWDGGARYGALRAARASQDVAGQQLESTRRTDIIQVEQAQRQLVVAGASDRVAREQRDLAAQNDQMTQTAYAVGQGTSLELVTASEAHRQAELNLALQDFGVVKARILAVLALATCPW